MNGSGRLVTTITLSSPEIFSRIDSSCCGFDNATASPREASVTSVTRSWRSSSVRVWESCMTDLRTRKPETTRVRGLERHWGHGCEFSPYMTVGEDPRINHTLTYRHCEG